jgi:two-component system, cell cycle sensor histidine kinase and response regulator CckA
MNCSATCPAVSDGSPESPVILLVEDESIVREVTRQVLQYAGYEVLESSGAEEALRVATQHRGRIGLLLTDVVMPGMNGAELAHRLESTHPDLVTVFMSGYAESDVLRDVMRRKPVIHIQKPFTVEVLLSRIADALQGELVRGETSISASLSS